MRSCTRQVCSLSTPNAIEISHSIYSIHAVSAISLLLYDRILSLSDDVQYIWTRRMSYSKIIYLCQQYLVAAILLYFTIGTIADIIGNYKIVTSFYLEFSGANRHANINTVQVRQVLPFLPFLPCYP